MKTKIFLFISLTFFGYSYAQIVEHVIQVNANGPVSAYTADINNDGYMDVISSSFSGEEVFWHENTDGQGTVWVEHIIEGSMDGPSSVFAAYINNDGFIDVLSASVEGTVAWYENTDGQGNFVTNIIATNVGDARQVHADDIDGDGDMDVLSASSASPNDNTIAWYENIDGEGTFGNERIISTSQVGSRSVYTADLDGDGDNDVLAASWADGKVAWYENTDGQGTFGNERIISTYDSAWRVTASDLDGDGDMDAIAVLDEFNSRLDWYENDGQGNFIVHEISTDLVGGEFVYGVDLDGDGDNDVLCADYFGNEIIWFENNLNEPVTDWEKHVIQEDVIEANSVHAADIDGDGLMDVIATGNGYGKVVWYEQEILGLDENTLSDFSVYPNPTTGVLNIQSKTNIVQIEIYNQLGQIVLSNSNKNTIDISRVSQGIYFIKIMDENGNFGTKKVIRK